MQVELRIKPILKWDSNEISCQLVVRKNFLVCWDGETGDVADLKSSGLFFFSMLGTMVVVVVCI